MFKSLVSAAAIFSMIVTSLVSPVRTYACPDEPPSTLLSLYKSSDAIYVGTFDRTADTGLVEKNEDSEVVIVTEDYSISNTLKGENRKFYTRSFEQYRYKPVAAEPESDAESGAETPSEPAGEAEAEHTEEYGEEEYGMPKLEPGDTVILFLKYAEKSEETADENEEKEPVLDVAHYRDAIKKVTAKELSSFEARINELNGLFDGGKKPSDAAIAAWLVKCIEDPATRWDGAFELIQSFETLEWMSEFEKQEKEKAANGEEAEVLSDEEMTERFGDRGAYAKALTGEQKAQITGLLLDRQPELDENGRPKKLALGEADEVLIDLVKRWGDARFASFVLDRLRNSSDESWEKQRLMNIVAEVLKDGELSKLNEEFGEVAYQADDEPVKNEAGETTDEPVTEGEPAPSEEGERPAPTSENEKPSEIPDEEEPPVKTYGEVRSEIVGKFIARADLLIADARATGKL